MDKDYIRFTDFINTKNYCDLQFQFGKYDYQCRYEEKLDKPIDQMTITYYEREEFGLKESYTELEFEKDYVMPALIGISLKYFEKFKSDVQDKVLHDEKQRSFFADSWKDKIYLYQEKIIDNTFLSLELTDVLIEELETLENFLIDFIQSPFVKVQEKLQFNWNRTDIIYFFHLLRLNKTIEWIEDADLGRILDSIFEYNVGGEKYYKIDKSRSLLNRFKNIDKPTALAIKRLKERMLNEDFYNH